MASTALGARCVFLCASVHCAALCGRAAAEDRAPLFPIGAHASSRGAGASPLRSLLCTRAGGEEWQTKRARKRGEALLQLLSAWCYRLHITTQWL